VELVFLSPLAGVLALVGLLPLAAFLGKELHARRVRARLGLAEPSLLSRVGLALALAAVPVLLGVAAMQPVADFAKPRYTRADAEAFFVFDTSRSMLAADTPDAPTRFERSRAAGKTIRAQLRDVPVGIASLTDRALPHLLPSPDIEVFAATVERALAVERPPPADGFNVRVSTLGALSLVARGSFFSPTSLRRLLVVLTDAESVPFNQAGLADDFRQRGIKTVFVRFWDGDERVFSRNGVAEPGYRPDLGSADMAERLAAATGGRAFDEDELGEAARAARTFLGRGPRVEQGKERSKVALAPYVTLGALVPLSALLWRRNL
jgi:hypothetical protein